MDIRRGGFLDCLEMGRLAAAAGGYAVPHNWGSQIGLLMGLHLAKAATGVIAAEDDRSTCDVIDLEGYSFRNGYYTVSNSPGLGITVNEAVYEQKCKARETALN
jgi:L-alanine-DL-glutamate epimerase-like enolase superfamily enzyme